jgi:hypothetical protein
VRKSAALLSRERAASMARPELVRAHAPSSTGVPPAVAALAQEIGGGEGMVVSYCFVPRSAGVAERLAASGFQVVPDRGALRVFFAPARAEEVARLAVELQLEPVGAAPRV